jgi:predicted Zn-ribbon and HTH transcriptional regulator
MSTPQRPRPPAESPPPAEDTPRARLRALLLEGPATARQLSERAHLSEKDVRHHLEHLLRSAKSRGEQLTIDPSRCESCGFVFRDRDRLGKPGRCPTCHSSHIRPPRFSYGPRP